MSHAQRKSLRKPEEVRRFPYGSISLVSIGETVITVFRLEPGWRWSEHVAPIVGTRSCQHRHVGVMQSGTLHVETDDGITIEIGPDDAYEIPPGHDAWVVGDEPLVNIEFTSGRVFAQPLEATGDRTLATLLFTDIIGSTTMLERLGDRAWRDLLLAHNVCLREQIDHFRGHEVHTTGDGFLARFDGAARAVRCGLAMARAADALGIAIRVGVHTGEVEIVGGDVRGLAVHAAARVMALAGAGEVFVSATTRDLLSGSGIVTESRGVHELKGLSGPREVFGVLASTASPAG
jgi:class 3 adenylate cyclase